jgi:exodeoxyribonuclease VII large subunit
MMSDALSSCEPSWGEHSVLSVSQLNARIRDVLRAEFFSVWVAGELADLSRPGSGHAYFALKDAQAQIRAVMWRSAVSRLGFDLEDGMDVLCQGEVDVYAPRGTYQLIIRQIEPRGVGAWQLALRKLRARLAAEGLFDPARKRSLPRFPRLVAVVTSPTGAALRDFWEVVRRRWQGTRIVVIPTRVQGVGAAGEIARAIHTAARLSPAPDVVLVTRGGGSLEDLWCFNDESVVRAICALPMPVVSAVGHEIDVTLADLAADVRALTPSEAGERIVPSTQELRGVMRGLRQRMVASVRAAHGHSQARLATLAGHRVFRDPFALLRDGSRRIDESHARVTRLMGQTSQRARDRLRGLAERLESLSPLNVLARGYTITMRMADQRLITSWQDVCAGDEIMTKLAVGQFTSRVEKVVSSPPTPVSWPAD